MQAGIWKLLDECVILQTKSFNVLQFRLELQNCIALQRSGFKVLLHAKSLYISPTVANVYCCDCEVSSSAFGSSLALPQDIYDRKTKTIVIQNCHKNLRISCEY